MKFAHLGDCHLGGWRQPELKDLNFKSFQYAIDKCLFEKVEFVLISGDLFDSAYPPIDTLKDTFAEFKKLKEANIPVFLIAGSHDYSVSGKTFLDVLDRAGLCKNINNFEEKNDKLILSPIIYKGSAIYGYAGKKSALDVGDIANIKLNDAPGLFKILMLHTTIRDAVGNLPIKAVDEKLLPSVDYLALSHLHINYNKAGRVYSGPIFPNNLSELEELGGGSFYIITDGRIFRQEIRLKDILVIKKEVNNALTATEEILSDIEKKIVKDKIIILKLSGIIERGKTSDIDFQKIEKVLREKGAFSFLKSTTKLYLPEPDVTIDFSDSADLENQIISEFEKNHPSKFNALINDLTESMRVEKMEDEKSLVFENRLMVELKRIFKI